MYIGPQQHRHLTSGPSGRRYGGMAFAVWLATAPPPPLAAQLHRWPRAGVGLMVDIWSSVDYNSYWYPHCDWRVT